MSTNLFKVSNFILQFKNTKHLELMTTACNIPGFTLGELNISRPVIRDARPGDTLTYNDLNVTILTDEKLQAYKEIYDYIIMAANPDTADLNILDPVFDSVLLLTTNKNNIQHKITFYNSFFKSVSDIDLTSTSTEEEQVTFSISLGYSYHEFA